MRSGSGASSQSARSIGRDDKRPHGPPSWLYALLLLVTLRLRPGHRVGRRLEHLPRSLAPDRLVRLRNSGLILAERYRDRLLLVLVLLGSHAVSSRPPRASEMPA